MQDKTFLASAIGQGRGKPLGGKTDHFALQIGIGRLPHEAARRVMISSIIGGLLEIRLAYATRP
jgi:hypothetical protein